jgi:hypothetical protein
MRDLLIAGSVLLLLQTVARENSDAFILCRSFTALKPTLNQCLSYARKKIDPIRVGIGCLVQVTFPFAFFQLAWSNHLKTGCERYFVYSAFVVL